MKKIVPFLYIIFLFTGCYSFKGISVPPDATTFFVNQVNIKASGLLPPPDTPERFMEIIRQKVRGQTQLKWDNRDPHIEFSGDIISYDVSQIGAQEGDEVSLNQLTIGISVEYTNNQDTEDTWKKTFTFGLPFDPSLDLSSVQDDLIEEILDQIGENIINDAFTNW